MFSPIKVLNITEGRKEIIILEHTVFMNYLWKFVQMSLHNEFPLLNVLCILQHIALPC